MAGGTHPAQYHSATAHMLPPPPAVMSTSVVPMSGPMMGPPMPHVHMAHVTTVAAPMSVYTYVPSQAAMAASYATAHLPGSAAHAMAAASFGPMIPARPIGTGFRPAVTVHVARRRTRRSKMRAASAATSQVCISSDRHSQTPAPPTFPVHQVHTPMAMIQCTTLHVGCPLCSSWSPLLPTSTAV